MDNVIADPHLTTAAPEAQDASRRVIIIDMLRGTAILGVVLFHLIWDLDYAGLIKPGFATSDPWLLYGRLLAGTFMFLVGVSLVLAHEKKMRWRAFAKRLLVVAGAAVLITVATKLAFPDAFIYFGILHAIFAGSLIGIVFLRLPMVLTLIFGVAIWTLPLVFRDPLFDPRWLAWIGFSDRPPPSYDFVPIFPWMGLVLLGIVVAKIAMFNSEAARLRKGRPPSVSGRGLVLCGRNSLAIYLVHQPVLLAIILPLGGLFA